MSIKVKVRESKREWHNEELRSRSKKHIKIVFVLMSLSILLVIASIATSINEIAYVGAVVAFFGLYPAGIAEGLSRSDDIQHGE